MAWNFPKDIGSGRMIAGQTYVDDTFRATIKGLAWYDSVTWCFPLVMVLSKFVNSSFWF
jgi:hypothetical protein